MDILEAIKSRKSIRGFKPDLVPKKILREIIDIASRSPSAVNTQPWEVTVVTGQVLDNIRQGNIEVFNYGVVPYPDMAVIHYEGKYKQRQVDIAIQLFGLMGIAREDKEKRAEWTQRGYRFFDAPAAIILFTDNSLQEVPSQFDIGAITQTICLAALAYGLGTCIEHTGVMFPDIVRRFTQIPESKRIATSIAIGYPDLDFPANKVKSKREPLESFVTWCGFA